MKSTSEQRQPNSLCALQPAATTASRKSTSQRIKIIAAMINLCIIILCLVANNNLINCQNEEFYTDCNQRHHNQRNHHNHNHNHQRQQRKYVPLQAAAANLLKAAADPMAAAASDHEEFSLLTSLTNHNQQQQQHSSQQLANTNYSLLAAATTTPATPTTTEGLVASASSEPAPSSSAAVSVSVSAAAASSGTTTPTMAGLDSIGSSVVLQPPVTTTSSIMSVGKTTATSPDESNSTSSATDSPASQPQPARQESSGARQQASRAMDDSAESRFPSFEQQQQQLQRGIPISSSPSSVSIITPLIGAPQQQQQHLTSHVSASIGGGGSSQSQAPAPAVDSSPQSQQQSMVRPIYVVGQPISERDYYSAANRYNSSPASTPPGQPSESEPAVTVAASGGETPQQQQQAEFSDLSAKQPAASVVDANRQQQQQVATASRQTFDSVKQPPPSKSTRLDDSASIPSPQVDVTLQSQQDPPTGERMSGPPLVYSGGFLGSAPAASTLNQSATNIQQQPAAAPRLFQQPNLTASSAVVGAGNNSPQTGGAAAVLPNAPRRPSLPPPVNQANAASGFRSPLSPSGPLLGNGNTAQVSQQQQQQPMLAPINSAPANSMTASFYQSSPPYVAGNSGAGATGSMYPPPSVAGAQQPSAAPPQQQQLMLAYNKQQNFALANQAREQQLVQQVIQQAAQQVSQQQQQLVPSPQPGTAPGSGRRPLNITRVEHISAECSNDLIRAVIVFNGTFKGIIYSSGYVNDPTCLYVNGTGSTRYEFSIRLNQCGTLGRQELHQPTIPGEARRRDQVMWNTLSIQYNSIIEQEWDEHFRVSCEYGSDFWKTVSFNPFNVETNTGSPVVFTINPPQCQMDVLLGHGMGPKIAVDGPVTVGDPLTLLIHMKSEKAGYDILVKNCVAHNGGKQRMQLIDSNGCVVNERFISPFRGTYNDNDLRHVTLYAYLKAFRFTGSPVLYLECEIHMCQSACPPQMCYWRRLSKRSVDDSDYEYVASSTNSSITSKLDSEHLQPVISDSLSLFKALQVRQEPDEERGSPGGGRARQSKRVRDIFGEDEQAALVCYRHAEVYLFLMTIGVVLLLLISVAVTCCVRLRKLARSNGLFKGGRLLGSPSLLSIGCDTSSLVSAAPSQIHSHAEQIPTPTHFSPNKRSATTGWAMAHGQPDIVRKQRPSPPNLTQQQQQYLASFAQFSPKPVHR